MKYAFMTFSCPELSLDEALAVAVKYGYDGIEPRCGSGQKHGVEFTATAAEREAIKAKAADSGIALCCIATSCRFADPATRDNFIAELRQYIDLAGDLGVPAIRVFGGTLGDGVDRAKGYDLVADGLSSVADQAGERGVTLCIETHDDWCTPSDIAEVIRRVNHSAVMVNWDIMHPVRRGGATMAEAYETLKPWIRHVHFHDGVTEGDKLSMVPIGTGDIDHATAVKLLLELGYDGYLSGEWINWTPWEEHLPRELATMKGYEAGQ
jgi:sugar phosphate isomerase/epimerase